MNKHQMKRYLEYRQRDALRAIESEGWSIVTRNFVIRLFKEMLIDIEEMW